MKTKQIDGKYYIDAKVVMLPTEKATIGTIMKCIQLSELHNSSIDKGIGELTLNVNKFVIASNEYWEAQHLYIISDEEIKLDDWYIDDTNKVRQSVTDDKEYWNSRKDYKKVIASTDTSLNHSIIVAKPYSIIAQPSPEFIQAYIKAYNKGKFITEVMVEIYITNETDGDKFLNYKVEKSNCIIIKKQKDSYTREKVHNLMMQAWIYGEANPNKHYTFRENWIEQNL